MRDRCAGEVLPLERGEEQALRFAASDSGSPDQYILSSSVMTDLKSWKVKGFLK
jgi:hypothetical protein